MIAVSKLLITGALALAGAAAICPLCKNAEAAAVTRTVRGGTADTAVVRLHISRMTCGTCPVTAHLALARLAGVYAARVTLDDSLGVVDYDPRRVTPKEIAAYLTKMTGFPARILSDSRVSVMKSTS